MKVLMLSKACVVGAYQRKLEELAACGIELTVIVPPYWKDSHGVIPLEKKFLKGYRLIVAPMRFNGHFHIHYYPSLWHHLREVRPDIVHLDEEPWDFVTYHALRGAQQVGARALFFTWQNLLRHYPPPFKGFEQFNFRHCAHAIAGNNDAVQVLRAKGYSGSVSVIPQFGVDPEIFKPPPQPLPRSIGLEQERGLTSSPMLGGRLSGGSFIIAYAGRLVPEKGIDVLLRAVAGLQGDWQVRLLASGPEQENLQRLAEQLHINARVSFERHISSLEMPNYYQQVDVLVLPSRSVRNWVEQFGRVLIEAMACGVPVIGSDCGEIPNTIGNAGLIFPEGDAEALRVCIERLMGDAPLRRQLSERGRVRVLEKFTQSRIAQQTAAVYAQMCSGG